jgi:transposase
MRRSFDGLRMMAEQVCRRDPFSGHLFVFCNRRGDRVKILYWCRGGFAIWYQRLEKGVFQFPAATARGSVEVEAGELSMLLEGIDLSRAHRRPRYRLAAGAELA